MLACINILFSLKISPDLSDLLLIPKVSKPEHLTNFRPISLCNVLYKIASKVLANRLKRLLPNIIAEEQSAFVPRRLIIDNVLIAYECMHSIRWQHAKTPFFCSKDRYDETYDRVEWNYLQGVLQKLGFAQGWINSVMRCVTSVRNSVRINGEQSEPFIPSRGLRQGIQLVLTCFCFAQKVCHAY